MTKSSLYDGCSQDNDLAVCFHNYFSIKILETLGINSPEEKQINLVEEELRKFSSVLKLLD